MRDEKKAARHKAITDAAYGLLAKKGYDGASMLSIAKAARASNETLYRWYGDKKGLFEAMARDNALDVETRLKSAIEDKTDPLEALTHISRIFLTMLLGDRAILLNRVAAADSTGEIGAAISSGGRDVIQPLFVRLMTRLTRGDRREAQKCTDMFLGLLVGDLQIKRVIGVSSAPTASEIDARVTSTFEAISKLLPQS